MKGIIRYQKELQKTYLIAEECKKELTESYAGKMVLQGGVKGLASCRQYLINGQTEIWYDVSSLQSLKQAFAIKELHFVELEGIIRQLISVFEETEKYLLDDRQLCFQPEYLFFDMEKEQIKFLYDYTEKKEKSDISQLAEFLLERICHEEEETVELAYYFYEQIQKKNVDIYEIIRYLDEVSVKEKEVFDREEDVIPETEPLPQIQECIKATAQKTPKEFHKINWNSKEGKLLEGGLSCVSMAFLLMPAFWVARKYFILSKIEILSWIGVSFTLFVVGIGLAVWGLIKEHQEEKDNIQKPPTETEFHRRILEEAIPKEDNGRTIYVGNALLNRTYCLIEKRKGMETEHPLPEYPFLIGKDKDRVNLILKDGSVSRMHACLTEEDGNIYIEDLHSTNGTYINDFPLEPHVKVKLKRGDLLQLGKVELGFR